MTPGEHFIVLSPGPFDAIEARRVGLQLRDTVLIALPGVHVLSAYLFRVPLEGTLAANVLKHGEGGIWIEGCRVRHSSSADFEKHRDQVAKAKAKGGKCHSWKNSSDLAGANDASEAGRWPPNIILVHGPKCVNVGRKQVKGKHEDEGSEVVANWKCQPDCPVGLLDEQSGERPSGSWNVWGTREQTGGNVIYGWGLATKTPNTAPYGDSGGAARYFPQFTNLAEALDWLAKLIVRE